MNATRRSSKTINPVQISRILFFLLVALALGGAGICYVSLKNTQHTLGQRVRETERQLREYRARNQDYGSRIASLSSRMALRRKLDSGFIALVPVQATAIARLSPPVIAADDGVLRTASANPVARP